jgi:hypothetical protein
MPVAGAGDATGAAGVDGARREVEVIRAAILEAGQQGQPNCDMKDGLDRLLHRTSSLDEQIRLLAAPFASA